MLRSITSMMVVKCAFHLTLCKCQKLKGHTFYMLKNSCLLLIDLLGIDSYLTSELRLDVRVYIWSK